MINQWRFIRYQMEFNRSKLVHSILKINLVSLTVLKREMRLALAAVVKRKISSYYSLGHILIAFYVHFKGIVRRVITLFSIFISNL